MLAWSRRKVSEVLLGIKDGVEGVFGAQNGSWRMVMWVEGRGWVMGGGLCHGRRVGCGSMGTEEQVDGKAGGGVWMGILGASSPVLQVWRPWITRQQGGWGCGQLCTTW